MEYSINHVFAMHFLIILIKFKWEILDFVGYPS